MNKKKGKKKEEEFIQSLLDQAKAVEDYKVNKVWDDGYKKGCELMRHEFLSLINNPDNKHFGNNINEFIKYLNKKLK